MQIATKQHYNIAQNKVPYSYTHRCRAVGRASFVFRFLQLSSDCVGLNRQDHSFTYSGGPKTEPCHRAARQSTVSSRSERTNVRSGHQVQNYRSLAWRSPQMSIANIVIILVTSMANLMYINMTALSPSTASTRQFVPSRLLKALRGV